MSESSEQRFLLQQNPWYQAAVGSVIVSAVFVVIIFVLLLVQTYHTKVTDPKRADKLAALRQSYQSGPADEAQAQEIRTMDARQRRAQHARMQFVQRGVVLFVGSLAVFVGSLCWVRSFRTEVPHPQAEGDLSARQVQLAWQARMAVTVVLVLLGGAGLFLTMRSSEPPSSETTGEISAAEEAKALPVFASWEQMNQNWPAFRGPEGGGLCPFENIPTEWDGSSGKNIRWKTAVPLPGHNSPILWENRVFLTGASEDKHQVYCFDADSGTLLWAGDVPISTDPEREDMNIMEDTGYAASTAATNGASVAAIFADGQAGCFDLEGRQQWVRSMGIPHSAYGYASSLAAWEDRLIIQMDQDYEPGTSKLIALDMATGKTLWQTDRPVPNSWTSPTVVSLGGRMQILTSGSPWVIGYDPENGQELWRVECLSGDVAPTQIAANGKVFAVEPYTNLIAIDPAVSSADGTAGSILWKAEGSMPDICSPISDGRLVWTLDTEGVLGCYDILDGSRVYTEDLDGVFQASPSLAGGTLYVLTTKGKMMLLKADRTFEKRSEQELGEEIYASPAFAPGRIYLRGIHHLYCIQTQP